MQIKLHFQKKGLALAHDLKLRVFGIRKWLIKSSFSSWLNVNLNYLNYRPYFFPGNSQVKIKSPKTLFKHYHPLNYRPRLKQVWMVPPAVI